MLVQQLAERIDPIPNDVDNVDIQWKRVQQHEIVATDARCGLVTNIEHGH